MDKIELSAGALLYSAIQIGAVGFYGVKDVFYGMSEEAVKEKIKECELELDAHGYGEMSFEGDFELFSETREMVEIAAFCDRYLQCTYDLGYPEREVFYFKGEYVLRLSEAKGMLILERISADDVSAHILENMPLPEIVEEGFCEELSDTVIHLLEHAAHGTEEEQTTAVRACRTLELGKKILEYFCGEARSASLTYLCPEKEDALSITYINSSFGDVLLELEPDGYMPWKMKKTAVSACRDKVCEWMDHVIGGSI